MDSPALFEIPFLCVQEMVRTHLEVGQESLTAVCNWRQCRCWSTLVELQRDYHLVCLKCSILGPATVQYCCQRVSLSLKPWDQDIVREATLLPSYVHCLTVTAVYA